LAAKSQLACTQGFSEAYPVGHQRYILKQILDSGHLVKGVDQGSATHGWFHMALRYVILSLVADKPQSGYDIVKSFEQSVGQIWQASHQQVYRELGKLANDNWLKFEREAQADKPDRKVYSITEEGLTCLRKWVASSIDSPAYRSPVLVRMLALPVVGPEALIPVVREARAEYAEKLKAHYAIEKLYSNNKEPSGIDLSLHRALRMAIMFTEPMLSWCDESIVALEKNAHTLKAQNNASSADTAGVSEIN